MMIPISQGRWDSLWLVAPSLGAIAGPMRASAVGAGPLDEQAKFGQPYFRPVQRRNQEIKGQTDPLRGIPVKEHQWRTKAGAGQCEKSAGCGFLAHQHGIKIAAGIERGGKLEQRPTVFHQVAGRLKNRNAMRSVVAKVSNTYSHDITAFKRTLGWDF